MTHRIAPLLLASLIVSSAFAATTPEWPEWRGPGGQGHASAAVKDLPAAWSETSGIAWKTNIPGRGWSSPVVDGKQIWLTTAIETPAKPEDAARRLKANTGGQPVTLLEKVELRAVCVDRDTGRIVHDILLITEREPQWVHELNSYASPTPVIENGRLYCHFGTFGTACVDTAKGAVLWKNTSLHIMHENGPGSSPVLWKNLLIFHLDGSDTQSIAALDKNTGKLVWKTERSGAMNDNPQLKKSYGTPIITETAGKTELISPAADWLYAYDPATGRELWKLPYRHLGFSISPRPVTGHGMIFMSTGFMKPEMIAIRHDGTAAHDIVWRYAKGAPNMPSPLLVGDDLYFVSDGGFLTCLDAKTGRENYRERLGGDYSSSPIFADGKIYISSRTGLTTVFKPGKTFELLGKNQLPGKIFATPAAVDGSLILRTDQALYRIGGTAKP
ncbi:MAG: PQQ-binding-like beta-propeller repeat protein [Chthoniobacteraceae bacterium]